MGYHPNEQRYESMVYNRCGKSGIKLPALSLGLWHNFGGEDVFENGRALIRKAFDLGITHFDLANNYGPPPGSAEENFGKILRQDFVGFRDEMVISTKAGYGMWQGPYGDWGSRKYLVSSLDQSLNRMGLDYVDIFYHHRPDPETPLEETMMALDHIVKQGKALYVGISNYGVEDTKQAIDILRKLGTPLLIHQPAYSMFNRWIEEGLTSLLQEEAAGCIAFVPLAQGLLTNRYLNGVPTDSRASKANSFLNSGDITEEVIQKAQKLNELAQERNQSLAQMAIAWVLREQKVTSCLIGASKVSQLEENVAALNNLEFSSEELQLIDNILKSQ
ncbi:L-glyceraldehyde 3-phosphate reductase [Anaerobacillus alkalilacustris]|uniref:L-glyceraldehyde 3-phosphate reductase n=1 Tax=Anaerobacillus alkalilacustris TaxID=393763 RepID=A0A1S2LYN1_9BACI|nr:L-glyceraldehyde 3-phosphate reductase [Anaerobacillus alkalilacustris]OIJ17436.1 L-glyceraldehyde 3-phosphate reductase [Anaerobacillus alkalilacustris]